jgi:hypothetical protein
LNPLLALLAAHAGGPGGPGADGGAPPDSISVNPGDHPDAGQDQGGGTDPVDALKQALQSIHSFVEAADDEPDKQVALQCYAKLQSILANEQKEKEQALGVTPQTKYLAKQTARSQ